MSHLKIIENGLIPIYENQNSERVVDARELHDFLDIGRDFTTWVKSRIEKYGFIESVDFIVFTNSGENQVGGRPRTDYILKMDTAKEIAMVENNKQGRLVRRYFIEVEKKFRNQAIDISQLSPELRMFKQIFDSVAKTQIEINSVREEIAVTTKTINTVKDTIIDTTEDWRDWINTKVKTIGAKLGDYRRSWNESYQELEKRAKCNLERRLENHKLRLIQGGAPKKQINNASYLDVIEQDQRLKEIYTSIVKELTIKYLD